MKETALVCGFRRAPLQPALNTKWAMVGVVASLAAERLVKRWLVGSRGLQSGWRASSVLWGSGDAAGVFGGEGVR